MPIWDYDGLAAPFDNGFTAYVLERYTCLYCKSLLTNLDKVLRTVERRDRDYPRARCCPVCGWWYVEEVVDGNHDKGYGGFAQLRTLDLSDIATPVDEVRRFLLAKYESRFHVNPELFEHTVAAVLRDSGYQPRVTSYRADNGIDIYLDGPGDTLIGVQVKRWRGSIKIEQIHALAGALMINNCTEGVFVTTSSFQRGAQSTAQEFRDVLGLPMRLIDAPRLYDALRITSREEMPNADDPSAPWNRLKRPRLWTY
jgi:hypothetical protein